MLGGSYSGIEAIVAVTYITTHKGVGVNQSFLMYFLV